MLMCKPNIDWVTYKYNLKQERFIKIGHGGEGLRPKDYYDANGCLSLYPVDGEHALNLRTKSQRGVLTKLLAAAPGGAATAAGGAATMKNKDSDDNFAKTKTNKDHSPNKMVSPKGLLVEYIK